MVFNFKDILVFVKEKIIPFFKFGKKADIHGVTFKFNNDEMFYFGSYNDDLNIKHKWAFKFDIAFGRVIRPIAYFWKKQFWNGSLKIKDVPKEEWNNFFGVSLANKLRKFDSSWYKYSAYNPWYAKYIFVIRTPKTTPTFFISMATPWFSFYVGFKGYSVDVFPGRDLSWTTEKDIKIAEEIEPTDCYQALCPSMSIRKPFE